MTTITANATITYKELQAWAKDNNVKANQSRETLEKLHAEHNVPVPKEEVNPFQAYIQTPAPKAQSNAFPPSVGALQYLTDLRTRHRRSLEGMNALTYQEAQKEIAELRLLPAPASDKQIETINKTIAELNENGDRINISEGKINSLTGGKQGTASKMIDWLFNRRQQLSIVGIPSDSQLERIVEWFLCPDIPFENYEVNKKLPMPHVSETAWRYMLPEEFKEEIKSKLTRADASKFIDEYRSVYYKWKQTRITAQQIKYIRQLDERLANIESQAEVTFAVDLEGNIIEVSIANKNTFNPRAHEPLTELQLAQLSSKEATTLIDQMRSELSETYPSIDNSTSQQDLNDKVQAFSERTGTGEAKNVNDARTREYHKLSDLIYKLEAVVGHANPDLHDMIKEVLLDNAGDSVKVANEIREFMLLAIDYTSEDREQRTRGALLQLTEDTEVGRKIAEGIANEVKTA